MSLSLLLGFIGAAFAGALAHEIAHWLVWKLSGRRPRIDWWGLNVQPRAGPRHTTDSDRIAAVAPYVLGGSAVLLGWMRSDVLLVIFGLAMVQIPSRADVETMRGNVEWSFGTDMSNP